MTKGRTVPLLAALWAGCQGLTGCHGDADQAAVARMTPQPSAPVAAKQGPTPDELTAGMVEAVSVGKSTVPVTVKFDLPQRPVLGQFLEVVIAVMPQIAANSATLQVTGGEGLQLAADVVPVEIPSLEPSQVYRTNVKLTPTAEGLQLLGLNITLKHDDGTEMHSFSVPIIVPTSAETATVVTPASTVKR